MIPYTGRAPTFATSVGLLVTLLGWGFAGGSPLAGQETEGPLSPAGRLRVQVVPTFLAWDSRFGERSEDGAPIDEVEALGFDLGDDSGRRLFPGVGTLETDLREFLGDPAFRATLGASRAAVHASQIRVPVTVDVGVLDWLTVGVTVPLVKNRTEIGLSFRTDSANLGLSPAIESSSAVVAFTEALRVRAEAAEARALELCGASPSSSECVAAAGVAGEGSALLAGFRSAYGASPFFPLATSAAAETLLQRVSRFNQGLASIGLAPLSSQPLFATSRLSAEQLDQLFFDPLVGLNSLPLRDRVGLWELGDVEVHAALRLLGGSLRGPADELRFRYLLGAGFLVRLGTGTQENPDVFLDLSSGDGQTDLEGRVFTNLQGARFGLWGDARYGIQRPTTVTRRIAPPDLVLVPAVNRHTVEWTPGNYLQLELVPRYHFTEELAFTVAYRLSTKERDRYTLISEAPGPQQDPPLPSPPLFSDPELLSEETEESLHELGGGLVFSTLEGWRVGRTSFPFEVWFEVRGAVAGAGGRTPKTTRASFGLRVYRRLWGS